MKTYLALLRGINVSGQKLIKMEDLRARLSSAGFENVATYIQSGNIVFDSTTPKPKLAGKIQSVLQSSYGFSAEVIVIDKTDLRSIVAASPFNPEPETGKKKKYVTFLSEVPSAEALKVWNGTDISPDNAIHKDKALYLTYADSAANTKLDNKLIEKKLGVVATTRNWNTTLKLLEMLEG